MDGIVQLCRARDNRNAVAMSTLRELGAARLGAFDTDKTAWGEHFETTRRDMLAVVPQLIRSPPRDRDRGRGGGGATQRDDRSGRVNWDVWIKR